MTLAEEVITPIQKTAPRPYKVQASDLRLEIVFITKARQMAEGRLRYVFGCSSSLREIKGRYTEGHIDESLMDDEVGLLKFLINKYWDTTRKSIRRGLVRVVHTFE